MLAVGPTEPDLDILKVEKLDACIRPLFANSVTLIEIERLLGLSFDQYLGEIMLQAGYEEKQIAIEKLMMNITRGFQL